MKLGKYMTPIVMALIAGVLLAPPITSAAPQISVSPTSFSDTLDIVSSFDAPGTFPLGLAFDGTYLWNVDPGKDKIYQLDTSGNLISSFDTPGQWCFGLAFDGTSLWTSDFIDQEVYQLDTSGNVLSSFKFSSELAGLASDRTHLWGSEFSNQKIYKLDTSGNILASFDAPGSDPTNLTFDGTDLWNTDTDTRKIYKLDTYGKVISVFDAPAEKPYGLAFDGTHLWHTDDKTDLIYQLKPGASSTEMGESKRQTFTVSNSGDENLVIGTLSLEGQDVENFSIQNDGCSGQIIAPSETATVDVVFSPTSAGGKVANLNLPSDDPDVPLLDVALNGTGEGEGYMITPELWIRAVIHSEEKGEIEAVWQKGGQGTTAANDVVIWGYFYASHRDVTWGSPQNPDLFVKIWFDHNGRVDVNYFHVSVPDIEVFSDYAYDGVTDENDITTMSRRYVRHYFENGVSGSEEKYENGNPPANDAAAGSPPGHFTLSTLRIGALINTEGKGPITAMWQEGGSAKTEGGHEVLWGHFYASPDDVTWGSKANPDLFVKIWFDADGRTDVNFFHVSVPDIEVYSDFPGDGIYDEKGTTIMDNRYIRHEYLREVPES